MIEINKFKGPSLRLINDDLSKNVVKFLIFGCIVIVVIVAIVFGLLQMFRNK